MNHRYIVIRLKGVGIAANEYLTSIAIIDGQRLYRWTTDRKLAIYFDTLREADSAANACQGIPIKAQES